MSCAPPGVAPICIFGARMIGLGLTGAAISAAKSLSLSLSLSRAPATDPVSNNTPDTIHPVMRIIRIADLLAWWWYERPRASI